MKHCIPDELFNQIDYPPAIYASPVVEATLDEMFAEMSYKIPSATDTLVKKELWHTVCDFCYRTGALLERLVGQETIEITPLYGEFIRVVGAGSNDQPTTDFTFAPILSNEGNLYVSFPNNTDGTNYIVVSVRPKFSDGTLDGSGLWSPKVPRYLMEKYGECIMHGALMRVFAMTGKPWTDPTLAKMHGVAYNNDLNRISFGLITSGMRKHLLIDVEDFIVNAGASGGNG